MDVGPLASGTRRPIGQIPAEGSVGGASRLRRVERQRLGRMPARAYAGNAHAAGEVAIGKTHPRAAEAALIQLLEMKARLQTHAPQPRADRPALCPPPFPRPPHPTRPAPPP